MLPIEKLQIIKPEALQPGDIVFGNAKDLDDPRLAFTFEGRMCLLKLNGEGDRRFSVSFADSLSGPLLRLVEWRIEIDQEAAYTGFSNSTAIGDGFLSAHGPGFVASFNYGEVFVHASGSMMAGQPDWTSAYVGFKGWRIVTGLAAAGETLTIAEKASE